MQNDHAQKSEQQKESKDDKIRTIVEKLLTQVDNILQKAKKLELNNHLDDIINIGKELREIINSPNISLKAKEIQYLENALKKYEELIQNPDLFLKNNAPTASEISKIHAKAIIKLCKDVVMVLYDAERDDIKHVIQWLTPMRETLEKIIRDKTFHKISISNLNKIREKLNEFLSDDAIPALKYRNKTRTLYEDVQPYLRKASKFGTQNEEHEIIAIMAKLSKNLSEDSTGMDISDSEFAKIEEDIIRLKASIDTAEANYQSSESESSDGWDDSSDEDGPDQATMH